MLPRGALAGHPRNKVAARRGRPPPGLIALSAAPRDKSERPPAGLRAVIAGGARQSWRRELQAKIATRGLPGMRRQERQFRQE